VWTLLLHCLQQLLRLGCLLLLLQLPLPLQHGSHTLLLVQLLLEVLLLLLLHAQLLLLLLLLLLLRLLHVGCQLLQQQQMLLLFLHTLLLQLHALLLLLPLLLLQPLLCRRLAKGCLFYGLPQGLRPVGVWVPLLLRRPHTLLWLLLLLLHLHLLLVGKALLLHGCHGHPLLLLLLLVSKLSLDLQRVLQLLLLVLLRKWRAHMLLGIQHACHSPCSQSGRLQLLLLLQHGSRCCVEARLRECGQGSACCRCYALAWLPRHGCRRLNATRLVCLLQRPRG
jgi:hypothetical protein